MYLFKYIDNLKYPNTKVIFEIKASSITEADIAFEKVTGINPSKANHIGCQVYKD
jgi:hypothetical protein